MRVSKAMTPSIVALLEKDRSRRDIFDELLAIAAAILLNKSSSWGAGEALRDAIV